MLLVAHYDGIPAGPSAADDAAGVAALLETLRARRAGPPLRNDVIALLPNDTDFTELKRGGVPGLNFAFIDQPERYHTPLDHVAHLDERSLQHHGASALALARHFGNAELPLLHSGDVAFYTNLSERGVELALEVLGKAPLRLEVADESDGIPGLERRTYAPRPPELVPFHVDGLTLVSRSYTFGPVPPWPDIADIVSSGEPKAEGRSWTPAELRADPPAAAFRKDGPHRAVAC